MTKKEDHVKDFTLCVASDLRDTPFINAVSARLAAHGCSVRYIESSGEPGLIRWQRRVSARYDEQERQWVPVDEYNRFEATNMIYLHAREIISQSNAVELTHGRIERLRRTLKLTANHQVFIMIDDLEAYYRKRGKGSRAANANARQAGYQLVAKQAVERALATLQVSQKCFVVHVEGIEDAAEWIYNMTAGMHTCTFTYGASVLTIMIDIGVKPHKYVPFFI